MTKQHAAPTPVEEAPDLDDYPEIKQAIFLTLRDAGAIGSVEATSWAFGLQDVELDQVMQYHWAQLDKDGEEWDGSTVDLQPDTIAALRTVWVNWAGIKLTQVFRAYLELKDDKGATSTLSIAYAPALGDRSKNGEDAERGGDWSASSIPSL